MDEDLKAPETVANQLAVVRFAWIFGAGIAIALSFPPILFAATVSTILGFSSGVLATIALFSRESVWSPHLNRWDVAASLYALSLFTGFFVDADGILAYIEAQKAFSG